MNTLRATSFKLLEKAFSDLNTFCGTKLSMNEEMIQRLPVGGRVAPIQF